MLLALMHCCLGLLPTSVRRTIAFPRNALVGDDGKAASKIGVRVDTPPFEAGGRSWQLSMYPCGIGESYANRVGLYLKLVGAGTREVDTTFSLSLRRLAADDAAAEAAVDDDDDYVAQAASTDVQAGRLGLKFRCGMTFCEAGEALESVGRCVDWGAHVCPTDLLLSELAADGERTVAVDVELAVWEERACARGASLDAFLGQTRRLPSGALRVGEVVVALGGGSASAAADGGGSYRCVPGVEYRVMRLEAPDGTARFELDAAADGGSIGLPIWGPSPGL